ncbi:diaminopimelate epimerase [Pseudonocardia eucalypti]|uniref:Diaminopimelate epimerase n=1 Tax=Pseudonocardia eucalypti TaxID=648755 RepID=A0ABP9R6X1_9PSEU|nr:diaminopimelate epimerase [Pseudonocardia eucalypti]
MADPEAGIGFRKGHGTENDFVLLPDPDGALELTESRVRALCDRHRGLGADGVLRVVRGAAAGRPDTEWFMDYRNADGSVAEMCGNGVRVFARYLVEAGLVTGEELVVGTRGGPKPVWLRPDGEITVAMGEVRTGPASWASLGGRRFEGLAVDVGNPHLACVTGVAVDGLDLRDAPEFDPGVFPHGVNVELVNVLDADTVRMRVYERGVGETRSCGTGTVAATAAALLAAGRDAGELEVRLPGGRVRVALSADRTATLTGPAVLVAAGELDPDWWRAH